MQKRIVGWDSLHLTRLGSGRSAITGVAWALFTVLVWGAWPGFTRLAVTQSVTPEDLVLLRYGIGGLILLPVLVQQAGRMPHGGWREGFLLALFQGAPLALLATSGARFAPASHLAALSPGLLPLFAATFGYVFFGERISFLRITGLALIGVGAFIMAGVSLTTLSNGTWRGDVLFVCAGVMGAAYAVRMRRSGLSAIEGAALIGVYSMIFYVPLYSLIWLDSTRLAQATSSDVLFQAIYQGVLMGAVSLFSLSKAIVILGAARAAAFLSLIPVVGAVLGFVILHEVPSIGEAIAVVAITTGALIASGTLDARQGKTNNASPAKT